MRAAYDLAAEADREGRAERVRLIESWYDDEPGPAEPDPRAGPPVWDEVTRPLPLVDARPFMTPAARRRASYAERKTQRWLP